MAKFLEFISALLKAIFGKKDEPVVHPEIPVVKEEQTESPSKTEEKVEAPTENIIISSTQPKMKILIDNGHGVNTKGKRSPFSACGAKPEIPFFEYKWNREIAEPVVERLKEMGYDAELLVPELEDISRSERCKRVNAICAKEGKNNVILISIHSNAAGNGSTWSSAKGWSAYTTKGVTKSDELAECLYDAAERNFIGRKIRADKSDGDRDWEANFDILANTNCPAVLTENFFYDNADDVAYILSDEGREAVIKTHVDGVVKYIKTR